MKLQRITYRLVLVLSLLSPFAAVAQSKLLAVLKERDMKKLIAFTSANCKEVRSSMINCGIFDKSEILKGYFQYRVSYAENLRNTDEGGQTWDGYNFQIIAKEDQIISWSLDEPDTSFIEAKDYITFLVDFKRFYGVELNDTNLFRNATYSLEQCGIGGEYIASYLELLYLIKKKDVATIAYWLRSGNIVRQLYAIEGYRVLNIPIDEESNKVISYVLARTDSVWTCSGCLVDPISVQVIVENNKYSSLLKK